MTWGFVATSIGREGISCLQKILQKPQVYFNLKFCLEFPDMTHRLEIDD
jgi:hypothetical protein